MAMASQQIKNVFDVPPYENLETLADTLLDHENERLRIMDRRLVDGSENSLDSLKRFINIGDKGMEPGDVEIKHPDQHPVVDDNQGKGYEVMEPGNVEINHPFQQVMEPGNVEIPHPDQQPVVDDNEGKGDEEEDEFADELGDSVQDDLHELHSKGDTNQFK